MKTITEYRPMVFSLLAAHAAQHGRRRRQLGIELIAVAAHCAFGLWLGFDTGLAPWQWQFWLVFAPFFIAGELAWRALLPPGARQTED